MRGIFDAAFTLPRLFLSYKSRRAQFEKLRMLRDEYGRVPGPVVAEMKRTPCERAALRELERTAIDARRTESS